MSDDEVKYWAEWAKELCLKFGTEVHTAYKVGAAFAAGLQKEVKSANPDNQER